LTARRHAPTLLDVDADVRCLLEILDLWPRCLASDAEAGERAHQLAHLIGSDRATTVTLRSLAWHLVLVSHRSAGLEAPSGALLAPCASAAASAGHASQLVLDELLGQLPAREGRVLLLGPLAASRVLLGRWDVLPAQGAVLVALDRPSPAPSAATVATASGVRWAAPGPVGELAAASAHTDRVGAREVVLPSPELLAVLSARQALSAHELDTVVFCAAARATVAAGAWERALELAAALGTAETPTDAASRLGVDAWLGLKVPMLSRLSSVVRRAFVVPTVKRQRANHGS
jgi:hypothetical protein